MRRASASFVHCFCSLAMHEWALAHEKKKQKQRTNTSHKLHSNAQTRDKYRQLQTNKYYRQINITLNATNSD